MKYQTVISTKYEASLDLFLEIFNVITNIALVMTKMANTSVSPEIHTSDETWL